MSDTTSPENAPTLSVTEAATRMRLSPRAVRRRLQVGTLAGTLTPTGWRIPENLAIPDDGSKPGEDDEQPASETLRPRMNAASATSPVDLGPLAELIERQQREIRELAEAATAWQFRAHQAEERLQLLTAGMAEPTNTQAASHETAAMDEANTEPTAEPLGEVLPEGFLPRLKRWIVGS